MSVYGPKSSQGSVMEGELKNPNELLEMYIIDEVSGLSDEGRKAFIESAEAEAMVEAGIISRKTLVRLSKNDDLSRRTKMAAFQLAKENNDPLWDLLVKNRVKERILIQKLVQKYNSKAGRAAKIGQKDYLKGKMPASFMRSGGAIR